MAGNWLFCNRRWLNPQDVQDRMQLESNYDAIVSKFPAFARCPRFRFLQCLSEVCVERAADRPDGIHRASAGSPSTDAGSEDRDESPHFHQPSCNQLSGTAVLGKRDHSAGPGAAGLSWSRTPSAGNYFIQRIPSTDSELDWCPVECPPAKRAAVDLCVTAAVGAGAWWARAAPEPNAGEAVDIGLYEHWVSVPRLRVEACELEQFGRSTSF
jgi:hypothetical protein